MKDPKPAPRRARITIAIGIAVLAVSSLALLERRVPPQADARTASSQVPARPLEERPRASVAATGTDVPAPATSSASAAPSSTSVVGRLMARYRSEDLDLLSTIARRTSAPPSKAVYRLLDAARAGVDDATLERMIRNDIDGALVRHDCFEWLRARRGEPRRKAPALASRAHAR